MAVREQLSSCGWIFLNFMSVWMPVERHWIHLREWAQALCELTRHQSCVALEDWSGIEGFDIGVSDLLFNSLPRDPNAVTRHSPSAPRFFHCGQGLTIFSKLIQSLDALISSKVS